MKKYFVLILLSIMPKLVMAQVAGGEVRRPSKPAVKSTLKPTPKPSPKSTPNLKKGTKQGSSASQTSRRDRVLEKLVSNMVYVEGGTFTMGATSEQNSDASSDVKPAHQVNLSSFSIGRYEVTQEEWETVMGSNPSYFKGKNRPVEMVSWKDCQDFIKKLNQLTGMSFRLPTEAEWEYAARGGSKSHSYKYSGGNDIGSVAWYWDNSSNKTHEVGQKQSNELGLYDMSGNVKEWCFDWKGDYLSSSLANPKGPSSGSDRVNRGGSRSLNAGFCSVFYRDGYAPSYRNSDLGLRLAL